MQLLDQIIVPCELDADGLALAGADRDVSRGDRMARRSKQCGEGYQDRQGPLVRCSS
jgi:hypothetical protein